MVHPITSDGAKHFTFHVAKEVLGKRESLSSSWVRQPVLLEKCAVRSRQRPLDVPIGQLGFDDDELVEEVLIDEIVLFQQLLLLLRETPEQVANQVPFVLERRFQCEPAS